MLFIKNSSEIWVTVLSIKSLWEGPFLFGSNRRFVLTPSPTVHKRVPGPFYRGVWSSLSPLVGGERKRALEHGLYTEGHKLPCFWVWRLTPVLTGYLVWSAIVVVENRIVLLQFLEETEFRFIFPCVLIQSFPNHVTTSVLDVEGFMCINACDKSFISKSGNLQLLQ